MEPRRSLHRCGEDPINVAADLEADLAEIVENLVRENLNPSQRAIAVKDLQVLTLKLEEEKGEAVAQIAPQLRPAKKDRGKIGQGKGSGGHPKPDASAKIAKKYGIPKDVAKRDLARAEAITKPVLEQIVGTDLDKDRSGRPR